MLWVRVIQTRNLTGSLERGSVQYNIRLQVLGLLIGADPLYLVIMSRRARFHGKWVYLLEYGSPPSHEKLNGAKNNSALSNGTLWFGYSAFCNGPWYYTRYNLYRQVLKDNIIRRFLQSGGQEW
jgi:hypothetical protein